MLKKSVQILVGSSDENLASVSHWLIDPEMLLIINLSKDAVFVCIGALRAHFESSNVPPSLNKSFSSWPQQ